MFQLRQILSTSKQSEEEKSGAPAPSKVCISKSPGVPPAQRVFLADRSRGAFTQGPEDGKAICLAARSLEAAGNVCDIRHQTRG